MTDVTTTESEGWAQGAELADEAQAFLAHPGVFGARAALDRARAYLLSQQAEDGHWRGLLQTNVTMDAEDLLLREFLGIRDPEASARSVAWILSQQNADGSWSTFHGGEGDLSTTIEAYWALKLAGEDVASGPMSRAAAFCRAHGGPSAARVFTQIWMALFGLWPWDELPALPPEIMLLPAAVPLNPYDFGCWARQTIVALTIVYAHRPVHPLSFDLAELGPGAPASRPPAQSPAAKALVGVDRVLRVYEKRPLRPLRSLALKIAERWIVARQEADGGWGGIQPPLVYSILALTLQGYPLDHPVIRAAFESLAEFTIDRENVRWVEACQSPVWDTALALIALSDSGSAPDDPDLLRAGRWLLDKEVTVTGDWAIRRPHLRPGGWSFEYANVHYPDLDDSAEVGLALRRVAFPGEEQGHADAAIRRSADWIAGMQSRGGGWGAFDVDNVRRLCKTLPFCDFGEVIDPPSADVTAHAIEFLSKEELEPDAAAAGLTWLVAEQEPDGSWWGRWGVNHIYGTWSALYALEAAGVPANDPIVRRGVDWLLTHQNSDGGWGEDCRSYVDRAWIGRGESTASQTAWALLGLHAAGEGESEAVRRGTQWLVDTQRSDGTWDEPYFTGTGFPGDFYINYHLYRLVFPISALGRCLGARPVDDVTDLGD